MAHFKKVLFFSVLLPVIMMLMPLTTAIASVKFYVTNHDQRGGHYIECSQAKHKGLHLRSSGRHLASIGANKYNFYTAKKDLLFPVTKWVWTCVTYPGGGHVSDGYTIKFKVGKDLPVNGVFIDVYAKQPPQISGEIGQLISISKN